MAARSQLAFQSLVPILIEKIGSDFRGIFVRRGRATRHGGRQFVSPRNGFCSCPCLSLRFHSAGYLFRCLFFSYERCCHTAFHRLPLWRCVVIVEQQTSSATKEMTCRWIRQGSIISSVPLLPPARSQNIVRCTVLFCMRFFEGLGWLLTLAGVSHRLSLTLSPPFLDLVTAFP